MQNDAEEIFILWDILMFKLNQIFSEEIET